MKRLKLLMLAAMVGLPAYAQSLEDATIATDDPETDAEVQAVIERPDMPGLFFREEQRRVLEAVRQGVVNNNDFVIEEFSPVLIEDPVVPVEERQNLGVRSQEYYFDAYIVNRSTGKTTFWLNRQELNSEKDADALRREGLTGLEEGELIQVTDGVLSAGDVYNKSNFRLKIGQIVGTNGTVEETLPVIKIKKK